MDFTIQTTLQEAIEVFNKADKSSCIENPRLETELLMAHALGISRSQVIINSDKLISNAALQEFKQLVIKKITGIPTAYLLGNAEFFGRKFWVDKSVLIPRPETEELVEWILLSHAVKHGADSTTYSILDICAGSGCIGITLACEMPINHLCLSDQSTNAQKTSEKNFEILRSFFQAKDTKVDILKSDLFEEIHKRDFNIIISNPPYVTRDEYEQLDINVKNFEPREALLILEPEKFNERLVNGAFERLVKSGWLYLETSPTLIESLHQIFEIAGFTNIESRKDLSGKDRFIRGQRA